MLHLENELHWLVGILMHMHCDGGGAAEQESAVVLSLVLQLSGLEISPTPMLAAENTLHGLLAPDLTHTELCVGDVLDLAKPVQENCVVLCCRCDETLSCEANVCEEAVTCRERLCEGD